MQSLKLIKKAQKGDKEALVTVIMDKKEDLYRLSYVYMKNSHDAQDALEDMIVIVYEKIHTLKKASAFDAWCRQILVNCCKKKFRENSRVIHMDAYESGHDGGIKDLEDQMTLDYYLDQLSDIHSDVIRLKYLMDYDLKTISKVLDIPVGTVKSRLSNGMSLLREIGGTNEVD